MSKGRWRYRARPKGERKEFWWVDDREQDGGRVSVHGQGKRVELMQKGEVSQRQEQWAWRDGMGR